ncbi:Hypothetical predicted protein [Mytilus galloprovincialis]|uniref:Uncharacterized protein n=1 Tax=Mytilus galloprovincialis TaxID=29158 RepID=A0A8B6H3B3_MYTGA|nr:Hypothetical predicted protein [Mytilus galloprovincialis]
MFSNDYRLPLHLTRLKIDFCLLPSVNNETFRYLPFVDYIELTNCRIQNYDVRTLPNRKNLKYLDISHNLCDDENLRRVMQDLVFNDELKVFNVTNCCPFVYKYMSTYILFNDTKIEKLYVNNNSFVEAPVDNENVMLPTNLKVFDFSNNKLGKVFFGMPYCRYLT